MSADLKRVRASQDEGLSSPASKKRALTASGSGNVSISAPEEESGMEDWMRVVETPSSANLGEFKQLTHLQVKRKEAIYRQMLEYRRSYETEARKVRELDEQRKRLEASVHAVEICWTQLVNAVRTLVPDGASSDTGSLEPILEPQISQPALEEAMSSRLPATRQLINRFVSLASKSGARTTTNELQEKCLRLQAESSTLRSANHTLQSQLSTSTEASDKYRSDLARAQKRLDKQRMDHDLAEQEWRASRDRDRDRERTGTPGLKPQVNGAASGHATPNGRSESDIKPNLDRAAGLLQDTTELEQLADSRLKELISLRSQHTALQNENDVLRQSAIHPSEESLRSSPFFQLYLQQISQQYARAEAFQQKFEASDQKLDKIRQDNLAFREAVIADSKVEVEQLRKQAQHRNSDLTRIRAERDEMSAELTEKKMLEENRYKWTEEMEGVMKSQEARAGMLSSEVRRLKGALGAEQGSKGYLDFLADGGDEGYVKSLEDRLADTQGKLSALSSDSSLDNDARVELEQAKRSLAKYERILGPNPETADDVVRLAQQLQSADTEKSSLLLQLEQAKSSNNSVYTDLEALDKLTQALQTQLQSKVFDLRDADARMGRLTTEKAKADNRYFQTMRGREAIEGECKAAQRTVEKQLKLLEKAREVEKGLQGQITSYEKGFIAVKNEASAMQNQLATVTSERTQYEIRYQQAQSALLDAQTIMQQRVAEASTEKELRIKAQEEVDKATTALKKLKDRQEHLLASSSAGGSGASATELQMREERDKLLKLLRCSCCEQNFKTQVIVKCMHTFCKPCLDSRVASRQRKCPACGLSFAKEDVQTLYWQ